MVDSSIFKHDDGTLRRSVLPGFRLSIIAVCMAALLLSSGVAAAADRSLVTIEDRIWGFDGRVQVGQFNPVSLLIDNRTDDAIDVVATFSCNSLLNDSGIGTLQQPLFIGPGARRWVQFYAYIPTDDKPTWNLRLGEIEFPGLQQPRSTLPLYGTKKEKEVLPVAIIMDPPGAMNLKPASVKHFPDVIFPPWATATVGLNTVFLDYAPDWEVPRQAALLSWLKQGGRLQLLRDARGQRPEFDGLLAELNQPLQKFSVGNGVVERMNIQRNELSRSMVRGLLAPVTTSPEEIPEESLTVDSSSYDNYSWVYQLNTGELDGSWFRQMRQLTQPQHAWWLIYLLAFAYIGLIFPGCWILARRNRHFLEVYGAIFGLSVVFSLLFLLIGRRGQGETTSLHTIALAQIEGPLQTDAQQSVMEWNALFVTSGDEYAVTAADQQAMFAVPGIRRSTDAEIAAGNEGRLDVSIPPFSSQTFVCRRQLPAPDWQMSIASIQRSARTLDQIRIQGDPEFRAGPHTRVRVLLHDRLYQLKPDRQNDSWGGPNKLGTLKTFCKRYTDNNFGYGLDFDDDDDRATFYKGVMDGLMIRSLIAAGMTDPKDFKLSADRIRLFVYDEIPQEHFVKTNTDRQTDGRILYVLDLPLSSASAVPALQDSPANTASENE